MTWREKHMTSRRILITGARGQLAADLRETLSDQEVLALDRTQLDICSNDQMADVLTSFSPDIVLNTAAFHQVDRCESEPEQSFAVNAAAPQRLAAACDARGCTFVHF